MKLAQSNKKYLIYSVFLPIILLSSAFSYYFPPNDTGFKFLGAASFLGCLLVISVLRSSRSYDKKKIKKPVFLFFLKIILIQSCLYLSSQSVIHAVFVSPDEIKQKVMSSCSFLSVCIFYLMTSFIAQWSRTNVSSVSTIGMCVARFFRKQNLHEDITLTCNFFIRMSKILSITLVLVSTTFVTYGLISKNQVFLFSAPPLLMLCMWLIIYSVLYSKTFMSVLRTASIHHVNLMTIMFCVLLVLLMMMWVCDNLTAYLPHAEKITRIKAGHMTRRSFNYLTWAWCIGITPFVAYMTSQWVEDRSVFQMMIVHLLAPLGFTLFNAWGFHHPWTVSMSVAGILIVYTGLYGLCSDNTIKAMLVGQAYMYSKNDKSRGQVVFIRHCIAGYVYGVFLVMLSETWLMSFASYMLVVPIMMLFLLLPLGIYFRLGSHNVGNASSV